MTEQAVPPTETETSRAPSSSLRKALLIFCNVILPPAVILGGFIGFRAMMATGPTAERKRAPRRAVLVSVVTVKSAPARAVIDALGTVKAAREVALRPRVSGEVLTQSPHLIPGARFTEGDVLLTLDPTDYELMVKRREIEIDRARADPEIEMGNQLIAKREFEILGEGIDEADRALILREPQLAIAGAAVRAAEVALTEAKNDVKRTTIRAPFNCIVRERLVDVGAQVGIATTLAELIGTDEYWVEVSLPVDQLRYLTRANAAGEGGAKVRVFDDAAWGAGVSRFGRVIGMVGSLEPQGRMARMLIAVDNPIGGLDPATQSEPELHLGSWVRVEMEGAALGSVLELDPTWVREGDRAWVYDADGTLKIVDLTVAYRQRDRVYVSGGLEEGERIVTTDLAAPVAGMGLRLAEPDDGESPR